MFRTIVIFSIIYNIVLCQPQEFVSFKDGKIGVNFGGYHAEAGLGALLTGNVAHGGLSASAGTPYGQRAAAGIGGATGGNSQGGAYASASAGGNVGASAGLGAIAGGDAGLGAEAHAGQLSSSASGSSGTGFQVSKTAPQSAVVASDNENNGNTNVIYRTGGEIAGITHNNNENNNNNNVYVKESVVQRIKSPKKYARVHGHAHVAQPSNTVTVVEKTVQPQQVIVTKTIEPAPPVVKTKVVTKTKSVAAAPSVISYQPPPPPPQPHPSSFGYRKTVSYGAGGGGGAGAGAGAGAASGSFSGNFNSAGLFDSIFNIPIATLKAVNGLVNNVASGVSASGNVAVSKSVGVHGGSY